MTASPAITITGLSKAYRISHDQSPRATNLGEAVTRALRSPFQRAEYETFWALRDIDLEIQRGEVVGVIGRNGAGKSTLLKVLSRITEPTSGRIELYGRVGSLLEVGTGFHPELTGRENIYLNGAILGMRRREIRRQFDEIVDFAGVEKFLDTPVKRYSSGMYVRLAFAVAAHLNPEILIVDEVLAVGDAEFQRKCLGKMQDVAQSGRTVLFVSHNMAAVKGLCTHGVVLRSGQLEVVADVAGAIAHYTRASVAVEDRHEIILEPNPSDTVHVRSLSVNDGSVVMHGQPMSVSIDYETDTNLTGVAIGIGINHLAGPRIISLDSDVASDQRLDIGGSGSVTVSIPDLDLEPGKYEIDLAVRCGLAVSYFYRRSCMTLTVEPGPSTPNILFSSTGEGGVRKNCRWEFASNRS